MYPLYTSFPPIKMASKYTAKKSMMKEPMRKSDAIKMKWKWKVPHQQERGLEEMYGE